MRAKTIDRPIHNKTKSDRPHNDRPTNQFSAMISPSNLERLVTLSELREETYEVDWETQKQSRQLVIYSINTDFNQVQAIASRPPLQFWTIGKATRSYTLDDYREKLLSDLQEIQAEFGIEESGKVAFVDNILIIDCGSRGKPSSQLSLRSLVYACQESNGTFHLRLFCNGQVTDVNQHYM